METATFEKELSTGLNMSHLAARAAEGKMLAEDLAEIGKRKAQRMLRKGREACEDCLDETKHCIKHHPWPSVAVAAGVGALAGALCAWSCCRVFRR